MSNKTIGNKFEEEFCEMMFKHGFWAHNMAQKSAGQPADVIAVKNEKAYLIDCKVCTTTKGFALSRIEDNQENAMMLWHKRTGKTGWFAIRYELEDEVIMLSFTQLKILREDHSYLNYQDAVCYGKYFEDWVNGS